VGTASITRTAGTATTVAPGLLRSLVATGMCGASTALLATVGESTARATHARLDEMVSVAVLAVGAVAAALLTVGCVLLTLSAVARAAGRTLGRLERVGTRLTPAILRRAVAVTITTGIGLGAVSGVATASDVDLGWEVTESTSASNEPAHPEPAAEAPGPGEADTAAEPAEQVPTPEPAGSSSTEPDPAPSGEPGPAPSGEPDPDLEPTAPDPDVEPSPAETLDPAVAPASGDHASATAPATRTTTTPATTTPATTTHDTAATTTHDTAATTGTTHPAVDGGPTAATTVSVRAGDTLWEIAAAHLPAGSDDAAVAAAWPRWYEANRDVIGPDPDLIHPGQVLTAPGAP
jgi:nucleoid-associated protein YgaU